MSRWQESILKLRRLATASLILALPLQTHYLLATRMINGQAWEFGRMMIYGTDLVLLLILVSHLVGKKWSAVKLTKAIYIIVAVVIWGLASSFWANDQGLAIYALARLLLCLGWFWIISKAELNKKTIASLLIATAMIQAAWGLGQFMTQSAPANKWLGLAEHRSQDAGVSVVETIGSDGYAERWLRAYGGLPHPNILGGLLALALVLALGFIIQQEQSDKAKLSQKRLWQVAIILLSAGLFVSFSRSAILAAGFGLIVIAVADLKNWRRLVEPVLLIVITIGVCALPYGYLYQPRLANSTRLENKSSQERLSLNRRAYELIKAKPLTGVGLANFGLASRQMDKEPREVFAYQPVHNVWLLVAVEWGLLGLALLVTSLGWLIKKVWLSPHKAWKLGLIVSALVLMSFDHYLYTQALGVYLLALVLGLVVADS